MAGLRGAGGAPHSASADRALEVSNFGRSSNPFSDTKKCPQAQPPFHLCTFTNCSFKTVISVHYNVLDW